MEQQELQKEEPLTDKNAAAETLLPNAGQTEPDKAAPDTENAVEDELNKMATELAEQKDKYLRLFAEFDNYKRRTAKERLELIQTAGKEVIVSLLDVLDDCDRAEQTLQSAADAEKVKEGVALVFQKLRSTLESKGLKAMSSIGQEFNPDQHEAITEIPSPDMKGKVMDEVQKGYYLSDKIIRFAKVVVGS
jgi:molecular chaperone GrpE